MRSIDLNQLRTPQKLVENRISFAGSDSELSIYDTYDSAVRVGLNADQLLYCGMVSGRKVMHDNYRSNDQLFLPKCFVRVRMDLFHEQPHDQI